MGREQARQRRERQLDAKVVYEFGGPLGAALIMIVSHALVYYLYASHGACDVTRHHPAAPVARAPRRGSAASFSD